MIWHASASQDSQHFDSHSPYPSFHSQIPSSRLFKPSSGAAELPCSFGEPAEAEVLVESSIEDVSSAASGTEVASSDEGSESGDSDAYSEPDSESDEQQDERRRQWIEKERARSLRKPKKQWTQPVITFDPEFDGRGRYNNDEPPRHVPTTEEMELEREVIAAWREQQAECKRAKAELRELQADHEAQLAAAEAMHITQLAAAQAQHDSQLAAFQAELAEAKAATLEAQAALAEAQRGQQDAEKEAERSGLKDTSSQPSTPRTRRSRFAQSLPPSFRSFTRRC